MDYYKINSIDELYAVTSREEIMFHYFGDFKVGEHYNSPLRDKDDIDRVPSFTISYRYGVLVWRDFGLDNRPKSVINFVRALYPNETFIEILNRVHSDLVLSGNCVEPSKIKAIRESAKEELSMLLTTRDLLTRDYDYWKNYELFEVDLERFKVFGGDKLFVGEKGCTKHLWVKDTISSPMYYYLHDSNSFTVYSPKANKTSKNKKFIKYNVTNHIMGLAELKYSQDTLFITSSFKDYMVLTKLGFDVIAPHSESTTIPEDIMFDLKLKYNRIIVFYDNDSTGIKRSAALVAQYGLEELRMEIEPDVSDPSDFVFKYNSRLLKKYIDEQI